MNDIEITGIEINGQHYGVELALTDAPHVCESCALNWYCQENEALGNFCNAMLGENKIFVDE